MNISTETFSPSQWDQGWYGPPPVLDDEVQIYGSEEDSGLLWSTPQTNDCLAIAVSDTNKTLLIGTYSNLVTNTRDLGRAADANPTLVLTSATSWASATNQWIAFYHDGSNAYLDTGIGAFYIQDEAYATTHVHWGDNDVIYQGTGDDTSRYFDGTDLITLFASLGTADANGGDFRVTAQAGGTGGTGNHAGGDIDLIVGLKAGSAADGLINLQGGVKVWDRSKTTTTNILLDAALTTANTGTIATGAALTAGMEIASGAGPIVIDATGALTLESTGVTTDAYIWHADNVSSAFGNSVSAPDAEWYSDGDKLTLEIDTIPGLKIDRLAITDYKSATTVNGLDLYFRLQSAYDNNCTGGSFILTCGAKHGSGTDGVVVMRSGRLYLEPQASAGNTYISIDSGTVTANRATFSTGSSLTDGLELATTAGGIVLDALTSITLEGDAAGAFVHAQGALTASGTDDYNTHLTSTLNNNSAGGTDVFRLLKGTLTETDATGWNTVYLLDLIVGSTSKFSITDAGLMTPAGGIYLPDNIEIKFGNSAATPDAAWYSDGAALALNLVNIPALKIDSAAITNFQSLTGVPGADVYFRLQSALDGALAGGSWRLTTGAKSGAGADGTATIDAGALWLYDQAHTADAGININSALTTALTATLATGTALTSGLELATGAGAIVLDSAGAINLESTSGILATGSITASNAAGPAFIDEAASTTNPTLCPNKAETDTGLGWASDVLHFILGGATYANISTTIAAFGVGATITPATAVTGLDITGYTDARGLYVHRNNNDAETYALVAFVNDHATDTFATLSLQNNGTSATSFHITTGATNENLRLGPNGTGEVQFSYNSIRNFAFSGAAVTAYAGAAVTAGQGWFAQLQNGGAAAAAEGFAGASGTLTAGTGSAAVLGAGGAGGGWNFYTGAGGNGTTAGGSGGVFKVVCGNAGTGGTGANGSLQVWHGSEGSGDYVFSLHDSTNGYLGTGSGILYVQLGNPASQLFAFSGTTLYGTSANAYSFGTSSYELLNVFIGEDRTTATARSTSGLYFGLAQEARLRWNMDATNFPAASLILGLNAVGSAAKDTIAFSAAAITGFNALTTAAGSNLYAAMQSGLDSNAAGGSLYWSGGTAHGSGTGGSLFLTPGGTTSGARGAVTIYQNAIAATPTDALVLENSTASTDVATVQDSPAIRFRAHAWDTPTDLVDRTCDFRMYVIPTSAATVSYKLFFMASLNGASYSECAKLSNLGQFYATASIYAPTINGNTFTPESAQTMTIQNTAFTAADSAIEACTGAWTHSTGTGIAFELKPTWNSSGDARDIGLKIGGTETAHGTGGYIPLWVCRTGLAVTSSPGIRLENTTAATDGVKDQMSPRFLQRGYSWTGAASQSVDFFTEVLPANAATPTGTWKLGYSLADAAATYPFTVSSAGAGTFLSTVTATGFSVSGAACYYVGGTDVAVTDGGTGLSVWAVGDIVAASATTTLAGIAAVAAGSVLISAGANTLPTWSTDLATGVTIGTAYIYRVAGTDVAVADGGTGLSSYAVGDILHATGTGTIAGLADVATGSVLCSGGVGVVSSWSSAPSVASMTVTPAAGVVGLTCTAAAHTGTAGVIGITCTTAGSGVVGLNLSMTSPAAGLGVGDSMFGVNVLLVGDDGDNASSGKYAFQGGYVPSGGSGNVYCFYCPDTDFTYGLHTVAPVYIGATNIVTDTTTGMQVATGSTQKLGFYGATPVVQPAHVADPAACAAMTFGHVWNGATYPTAEEGNELSADLTALKAGIDANNSAIDSILAQLATLGLQASA